MLPAKRKKMLRILYVEAFIIWLIGFVVTGILGVSLITDASDRGTTYSESIIIYCSLGAVFAVSIALIVYVFIPLAITNILRISKLEKPKFYQCYRLRFYVYLVCFDAVIALMAEFINKTFVSSLVLGCLDVLASLCLGATLFIFFMKWDSFNAVIDNLDGNSNNDLVVDDGKSNYHLLVEDEEHGVEQVISKTNSLEEEDNEVQNPVVEKTMNMLFGWVKYL